MYYNVRNVRSAYDDTGAGGLSSVNASTRTAQNGQRSVQVFADENAMPNLLPEQNEEYASVPVHEVIDRENRLQPGRWNDSKVGAEIALVCFTVSLFGCMFWVCNGYFAVRIVLSI